MRRKWSHIEFSELTEKLIILFGYLWTMLYFGACMFNYSETQFPGQKRGSTNVNQTANLTLFDTIYFIVITISTVGYGDITPTTVPGQMTIILLILSGISILPGLITDMQESIKVQSSGAGTFTPGKNPFIIICGEFTSLTRITDIIRTILSKDHDKNTVLVLLSRDKLSTSLKYMLKSWKLKGRMYHFIGSGLERRDLQRIRADRASAVMIIASLTADDPKVEDEHNTLRAWSFYDYASHVPLYLETLLPVNDSLQLNFTTGILCISDFQQIFLAYNCIYRGVGTLMINLIRGSKKYSEYEEPWQSQYGDGASNRIIKEKLNPIFEGVSFCELSSFLYQEYQIVLFGVHAYVTPFKTRHVLLNPGKEYKIKNNDCGFFISSSYEDIKATLTLTKTQFLKSMAKKTTFYSFQMLSRSRDELSTNQAVPKDSYRKGYPTCSQNSNGISMFMYSSHVFITPRTPRQD
jgi:hypothetical protein